MELRLGQQITSFALPEVTPAQVGAYLAISRDSNPLHEDSELARRHGFEGPLVPGMLIVAEAVGQIEDAAPDMTVIRVSMQFTAPAIVGGDLRIESHVRHIAASQAIVRVKALQKSRLVGFGEVHLAERGSGW